MNMHKITWAGLSPCGLNGQMNYLHSLDEL